MALLGYKEIIELIDKVANSGIGAVEIESAGTRIRIEGITYREPGGRVAATGTEAQDLVPASVPAPTVEVPSTLKNADGEIDPGWHIVKSPIVGTFYAAPNPEAGNFVRVGDRVSKGDVLCIVEAMKLMNEIESDSEGEIARIFPTNGQPIEYGEKLFALKP